MAPIRNAVIHIANEQPLLADLFEVPEPQDLGLRCTNLRTLSGTRPIFADHVDSIFFFPYTHIRFVEIPPGAGADIDGSGAAAAAGQGSPGEPDAEVEAEPELEIDEDFLRRIRDV